MVVKLFKSSDGKEFTTEYAAFLHEITYLECKVILRSESYRGTYGGMSTYATLHVVNQTGQVVTLGEYGQGMAYRYCSIDDCYAVGRALAKALAYDFVEETHNMLQ